MDDDTGKCLLPYNISKYVQKITFCSHLQLSFWQTVRQAQALKTCGTLSKASGLPLDLSLHNDWSSQAITFKST